MREIYKLPHTSSMCLLYIYMLREMRSGRRDGHTVSVVLHDTLHLWPKQRTRSTTVITNCYNCDLESLRAKPLFGNFVIKRTLWLRTGHPPVRPEIYLDSSSSSSSSSSSNNIGVGDSSSSSVVVVLVVVAVIILELVVAVWWWW
jgi:hypothetical protein